MIRELRMLVLVLLLGALPLFGAIKPHGKASWYGMEGRKTASGERIHPRGMTAAHKTLPFGALVLIQNLRNRRTAVVRIIDRGPYVKGRIIDVSRTAAKKLGIIESGIAPVRIWVLSIPKS